MGIEFENKDEQQVSQVLASLSHVDPPGDFDIRVRSRIAAGRPAQPRSWFWPILAGATPLVLMLAIGSYFAFRSDTAASPNLAAVPITEQVQQPIAPSNSAPTFVANSISEVTSPGGTVAKAPSADDRMIVPTTPVRGPNVAGSYVDAVTERRTIAPRGIPSSPRMMPRPRDFDTATAIPIKDVLTQIGVYSQGTETGMKVISVTADGAANRLGLKANDVIESIDDKPVNEKTSYKGKFAGKKMRVIREGKPVEIDLSKP